MKQDINMTTMASDFQFPEFLVETDWLEPLLGTPGLLIFDCAVIAGPNPDTKFAKKFPFSFESGQKKYDAGHIPGSGFIDILANLTDKSSSFPLMSPPVQQFVEAMGNYGINNNTHVVLYSSTEPMWATRVWWLLRAFGFDNAAILNGGWAKWEQEERPVSQDPVNYGQKKFTARPRPELFADKEEVLKATEADDTCIINALPPGMHTGAGGPTFGRMGRIAGSVNVPSGALHEPETGTYLPIDKLREVFIAAGIDQAEKIITYCGGGIASSNDAFVLAMLGFENISVYDASMFEWGNDHSLPMAKG